jgi:tetratricopeptide (TPR) repeat protein
MRKILAVALAMVLPVAAASAASTFFDKGEALFVQNKPQDAQPLLESALNDDPANEITYLYLGIIYQQLGDPQKSIDILKRGLNVATTYKPLFYYNMGNDFYSRKEFSFAEEMYSSALAADRNLASASLNRANARLQQKNYNGALADYALFVQLAPLDPQRASIEKLMAMLRKALDDLDKARQEEIARQQALMNDVLNSLNKAGDDTKNLSVESIRGQADPVDIDIKD